MGLSIPQPGTHHPHSVAAWWPQGAHSPLYVSALSPAAPNKERKRAQTQTWQPVPGLGEDRAPHGFQPHSSNPRPRHITPVVHRPGGTGLRPPESGADSCSPHSQCPMRGPCHLHLTVPPAGLAQPCPVRDFHWGMAVLGSLGLGGQWAVLRMASGQRPPGPPEVLVQKLSSGLWPDWEAGGSPGLTVTPDRACM